MKTKIVKVFLYPSYTSLWSARHDYPEFFKALDDFDIELQEEHWDGTPNSLPKNEPVIVRASSEQKCTDETLARFCREHGHLMFNSKWQMPEDEGKKWNERVPAFLERVEKSALPKDKVIQYLRSVPKDTTMLGSGTHMRRKALLLVRLYKEHVMDDGITPDPSAFGFGDLGIAKLKKCDPNKWGLTREDAIALEEEIQLDKDALAAMGLDSLASDARAKSYRAKLEWHLDEVLSELKEATDDMQAAYESTTPMEAAQRLIDPHPLGIFHAKMSSRHYTSAVAQAMHRLYDTALPLVIQKLVAAGYPDSGDVIEWDYA